MQGQDMRESTIQSFRSIGLVETSGFLRSSSDAGHGKAHAELLDLAAEPRGN